MIKIFHGLFQKKIRQVTFEDVLYAIKHPTEYFLINILPVCEQHCLIKNTIPIEKEESFINDYINKYETYEKKLIIYGKNSNDYVKLEEKYKQLGSLGFTHVYIYIGGLFEWVLLQDIYGANHFPTTTKVKDPLEYKPNRILQMKLLDG